MVQTADEGKVASRKIRKKKIGFLCASGLAVTERNHGRGTSVPSNTAGWDQSVPIAGWVIARFLELDVPDAVREGRTSAKSAPIGGSS